MTQNEIPAHTSTCNSTTCYTKYVDLQDSGDTRFDGYHEWNRTAQNTCRAGQAYGRDLCGDLDRQFGTNPNGRLG